MPVSLDLWLAFVAASGALLLVPGPTVLLVLSYALARGRGVAVAAAAGVATGDFIAMSLSLAGLGALVATSAALFTALKWAGALYLGWLGLRMLRAGGVASADPAAPDAARPVFGHAAAVTALNPKSIAFFVAFVPHFLEPSRPLLPQAAVLVATFVSLAALNALAYALAAGRLRGALGHPAARGRLTRAGGWTLIAMGAFTALLRRPA